MPDHIREIVPYKTKYNKTQALNAKFLYITMITIQNDLNIHKAYLRLIILPSLQTFQIPSFERFA